MGSDLLIATPGLGLDLAAMSGLGLDLAHLVAAAAAVYS